MSEQKAHKRRRRVFSNRTHKMNIKWLEQNYSEAAQCYDLNK